MNVKIGPRTNFLNYTELDAYMSIVKVLDKISFAELWGIAIGDGWIGRGSDLCLFISGDPIEDRDYYDNHIKELFLKSFNHKVKPRQFPYWRTYGVSVGKKFIVDEFVKNNFPIGKKISIQIPTKFKRNKQMAIALLRGVFDTDGTIYFQKSYNRTNGLWKRTHHYIPKIRISSIVKDFVFDLKFLIDKFVGVRCHIEHSGITKTAPNPTWHIAVSNEPNIKKWMSIVRPGNFRHISKFLVWEKVGYYPPRFSLEERLKILSDNSETIKKFESQN